MGWAYEDGYRVTDAEYAADQRYASIAAAHGMENSLRALWEARHVDISPALAIAILDQESDGANVFGHDPTIYSGAGTVTEHKYKAYRRARRLSGNRLMQGVGPLQLTWWEFQDGADEIGGCWIPKYNIRYGFRHLSNLIEANGTWLGVERYNGSGPSAERYRREVRDKYEIWHRRFHG